MGALTSIGTQPRDNGHRRLAAWWLLTFGTSISAALCALKFNDLAGDTRFGHLAQAEMSAATFVAFLIALAFATAATILGLAYLLRRARQFRAAIPGGGKGVGWFGTSGTVVTEFILVLPVLWMSMAITVQLALIGNAVLVVHYAAFSAARAGIMDTALDPISFDFNEKLTTTSNAEESARLVTAILSPVTSAGGSAAAQAVSDALGQQGYPWGAESYASRYGYALAATQVEVTIEAPELKIPPTDISVFGFQLFSLPGISFGVPAPVTPGQVIAKVDYEFWLSIPSFFKLNFLSNQAPAGYPGRSITLSQTVRLQSTGGRTTHGLVFAGALLYFGQLSYGLMDAFLP